MEVALSTSLEHRGVKEAEWITAQALTPTHTLAGTPTTTGARHAAGTTRPRSRPKGDTADTAQSATAPEPV